MASNTAGFFYASQSASFRSQEVHQQRGRSSPTSLFDHCGHLFAPVVLVGPEGDGVAVEPLQQITL